MSIDAVVTELCAQGITVRRHAVLAGLTTLRVGGSCPVVLEPRDGDQLAAAIAALHRSELPWALLGSGSNVLASDAGSVHPIIRYVRTVPELAIAGTTVRVSAATELDALVRATVTAGLAGLETASGIPGTVGGAIFMNAGAFGRQQADVLRRVEVVDRAGNRSEVAAAELGFAYRTSSLQESGAIVATAEYELVAGDADHLRARREAILSMRWQRHPNVRYVATAGSFFRNVAPTSAAGRRQAAGWFLQQAGAGELCEGGAHTFARHANIVVADPGTRARDILRLGERMAAAVKQRFDLDLAREVRLFGDWSSTAALAATAGLER